MKYNPLTSEEERIIEHKGTEPPFSGEYDDFYERGTFICRRCNAPLFYSKAKFDAGCGWPAFDVNLGGAVKRIGDKDGTRTEILCANCGGHLGHVFDDGPAPTGKRYCINSDALVFVEEYDR